MEVSRDEIRQILDADLADLGPEPSSEELAETAEWLCSLFPEFIENGRRDRLDSTDAYDAVVLKHLDRRDKINAISRDALAAIEACAFKRKE